MSGYIPVVDFSAYSLDNKRKNVNDADLEALTDELMQAFTTVGFVYLKNTGIPTSEVNNVFDVYDKFCFQPEAVKEKYSRPVDRTAERHGWMALEREMLSLVGRDTPAPGDLKECFNIHPPLTEGQTWPEEIPEFEPVMMDFYHKCHVIAMRLLELIARGLGVEDVDGFLGKFKYVGKGRNGTNLRTLRYPPVPDVIKKDQVRCGEHTDFGCLTLLFQDNHGLEVVNADGEYVPASPIPGTVVVNIADTLQRWSADKLKSTRHRVVMPESPEERQRVRRSIAYFFHCDSDVELNCLDGSDKYEPLLAREYLNQQVGATYLSG
ncbi:PREDICTED: UPF0676 protein C1494.01-like isoform X2 [Branchiostoma belcheri]|uniref:UPF0676 protein C1494.01-like isoform X2 n=1 Tax=Branchiostoma belcheri TaxID=7741 RepID=A0A6P4Y6R1_BRABE|nr:PREDICTED: UPF0676 protein C1494.01-like isoform X2 [Branchiostoma belcheri]